VPLVLTQNEVTESGHEYDDVLGRRYEYPRRYEALIRPGERFVYYRGRRRADGGTRPQAYLGVGLIGMVRESPRRGRFICEIDQYTPFPIPVFFRPEGEYLEPGAKAYGSRAGLSFRTGVRPVDDHVLSAIVGQAERIAGAPWR
jgi:hypothetical protein